MLLTPIHTITQPIGKLEIFITSQVPAHPLLINREAIPSIIKQSPLVNKIIPITTTNVFQRTNYNHWTNPSTDTPWCLEYSWGWFHRSVTYIAAVSWYWFSRKTRVVHYSISVALIRWKRTVLRIRRALAIRILQRRWRGTWYDSRFARKTWKSCKNHRKGNCTTFPIRLHADHFH